MTTVVHPPTTLAKQVEASVSGAPPERSLRHHQLSFVRTIALSIGIQGPVAGVIVGPAVLAGIVGGAGALAYTLGLVVIRVGELAIRTGERAGLRGTQLRNLGLAALFHDIGKLEIPDSILTKPGALTDDEMQVIRTHPAIGERLMLSEPDLSSAAAFVRSHHERHDGRGCPDGLTANQIPIEVGIISTCDAYDAMCHTRHYRRGMGPDAAIAVLREHAGFQWDDEVVTLVVATIQSEGVAGMALDGVGKFGPTDEPACGCADALPDEIRAFALR